MTEQIIADDVAGLVERLHKHAARMHYWKDSAIGNRFECDRAGQALDEAAATIAALSGRLREAERIIGNINRRASPNPERTLGDCAYELMWIADEARAFLSTCGMPRIAMPMPASAPCGCSARSRPR